MSSIKLTNNECRRGYYENTKEIDKNDFSGWHGRSIIIGMKLSELNAFSAWNYLEITATNVVKHF